MPQPLQDGLSLSLRLGLFSSFGRDKNETNWSQPLYNIPHHCDLKCKSLSSEVVVHSSPQIPLSQSYFSSHEATWHFQTTYLCCLVVIIKSFNKFVCFPQFHHPWLLCIPTHYVKLLYVTFCYVYLATTQPPPNNWLQLVSPLFSHVWRQLSNIWWQIWFDYISGASYASK